MKRISRMVRLRLPIRRTRACSSLCERVRSARHPLETFSPASVAPHRATYTKYTTRPSARPRVACSMWRCHPNRMTANAAMNDNASRERAADGRPNHDATYIERSDRLKLLTTRPSPRAAPLSARTGEHNRNYSYAMQPHAGWLRARSMQTAYARCRGRAALPLSHISPPPGSATPPRLLPALRSREAAAVCSPGREPWIRVRHVLLSPSGATPARPPAPSTPPSTGGPGNTPHPRRHPPAPQSPSTSSDTSSSESSPPRSTPPPSRSGSSASPPASPP